MSIASEIYLGLFDSTTYDSPSIQLVPIFLKEQAENYVERRQLNGESIQLKPIYIGWPKNGVMIDDKYLSERWSTLTEKDFKMSLLDKIKSDSLVARKARATEATLLVTLASEATMVGKNDGNRETTDAEVVKMVKKFLDGANETIKLLVPGRDDVGIETARFEAEVLARYMPAQLTDDELRVIIGELVADLPDRNPKAIGIVMKNLTASYSGRFDGQFASKLIKEFLVA